MRLTYKLDFFNDARDLFVKWPYRKEFIAEHYCYRSKRESNLFILHNDLLPCFQNTLDFIKVSHVIKGMEVNTFHFSNVQPGESAIVYLRVPEYIEEGDIYITYALSKERVYQTDITLYYRSMYENDQDIHAFHFENRNIKKIVPLYLDKQRNKSYKIIIILLLIVLFIISTFPCL